MGGLMNEAGIQSAPCEALIEQLHRHFDCAPQYQCLLWVDPAQADPFEDNLLVEQVRTRTPIRHPRFDPLRAPYLVPLDLSRSADVEMFRDSVELAWLAWDTEPLTAMRGQPICGWVRLDAGTSTSTKALAAHWARNCHLHMAAGQARLLRFQDPGVREWLWPALSDTQQRALLGPVAEIQAIGRGQRLITHRRADGAAASPDGYPALQLNQTQWDQVSDYATVHAAWLNWRNSLDAEANALQSPGWERPVHDALAEATRLGLRDAADRELFALHALQLGAGFHRHAQLQEVWRKTQDGDFYGSAIEEITGHPADQLVTFIRQSDAKRNEGRHG
jgi:hypothetical protein